MPDEKISPDFKVVVQMTIEPAKNHLTGKKTLKISVEENNEESCRGIKLIEEFISGAYWRAGKNFIFFMEE